MLLLPAQRNLHVLAESSFKTSLNTEYLSKGEKVSRKSWPCAFFLKPGV